MREITRRPAIALAPLRPGDQDPVDAVRLRLAAAALEAGRGLARPQRDRLRTVIAETLDALAATATPTSGR
ncbi:hypothetical protein [Actinokineospora sp. UTMC 2448]|uniref:hypothetical protein n=1 Tax=Actinokineospora sp. UTMC 2448 TaxID=2268449 RepID=UPI00216496D2|nr:hypothetical protein [Actinokineospora sp. UTMC 2448]UVS81818.1 hypothetical protein Actkin_05582 [Actinokineospora sp. UTMC 2448]